jgi:hypothetical protein
VSSLRFLPIAGGLALLALAAPASAGMNLNSLTSNGLSWNALAGNGLSWNALAGNGLSWNALTNNALSWNGRMEDAVNDRSLALTGGAGPSAAVAALNGVSVEDIVLARPERH